MSKRRSKSNNTDESEAKNMTYYNVLGIPQNAKLPEIKKNFRKLAAKYHPDQPDGDASIFALVARAYECLSNEHKREEYDRMLDIEKKTRRSNIFNQKKAFEEFIKTQEKDAPKKEYAEAKYKIDYAEMDRKSGFDRSKYNEQPLSSVDAIKKLKDMELEREQEELEFQQPELFTAGNFDREKFNALFELKYKQNQKDNQLMKHTGLPSAFNDVAGSSFISCEGEEGDGKYGNIFDEGEVRGNDRYGSIYDTGERVQVNKDDLDKIKGYKTEYSTHNVIGNDYKSEIEKRLREREMEDKLYEARKYKDFDTDKTMGGYGFLHQVNLTGNELEWENEEIDESTIKKLIAYRHEEEKEFRKTPNISGKIKKH